ncbi:myelin and lymphocyte protein-like [Clarias gariepinus]|uniref:myelin and lymphocyte protein-like n=1 Tax=Clarias gariepinus TaxID=13013 RepID=UPI00234E0598|nr:myelin and lymphocyte protein-like [Clarias gariepinus]
MASVGMLPSGMSICCSLPDIFFLPELVFGGLVWILVACTQIVPANPQAYVMAVSLFCFCVTFLWMMIFLCGTHNSRSSWAGADVLYHGLAAMLYLSASVFLAQVTIGFGYAYQAVTSSMTTASPEGVSAVLYFYRLDISAVVFSFMATLLYTLHAIFSGIRWKTF